MMNPPTTYSEWTLILDALVKRNNDAEVLAAMQAGRFEHQGGVTLRFVRKLTAAVNTRLNAATDRFQMEITRANGQESLIIQSILGLRKELTFLKKVVDLPALPGDDRRIYISLVQEQADSIQRSLEESAGRERSGKLSSIIRNHKINSL